MKVLIIAVFVIGVAANSQISSQIEDNANVCISKTNGATFPVEGKDCNFYYCADQLPIELPCPTDDMQFSVSDNCCGSCDVSESKGEIASTIAVVSFDGGLTGNECYGQAHGALIPYPGDCTKYLVCEYYNGTVMNCPSGLHFNPVLCVCDWPTSAGCTENGSPTSTLAPTTTPTPSPPSTETSTATPTTTPTPTPTITTTPESTPTSTPTNTPESSPTPTPTSTPTSPSTSSLAPIPTLTPDDDICLNQTDGVVFPYPWDCAWYIRCEDNKPIVRECDDGWLFNPILLICDYPENAGCIATPYPTTKTTPSTPQTQTPTQSPTPTPTEPITPTTSISTPTTSSTSDTTSSLDPVPTLIPNDDRCLNQPNGTLLPYPYDCAWYIRCEENEPIIKECEDGWLFNPILLICDYPENVGCVATPYPTTITTPSTPQTQTPTQSPTPTPTEPITPTTSISTPTTSSTSDTTSSLDPVPTLIPNDDRCINQPNGTLLPYPYDCAWYIRCEENEPIVKECEDGWLFNSILLICDYPENVGCVATPYPTTITTPSTPQTQTPTQSPTPTPTEPITPTTSISTPTASSTSDTTSSLDPVPTLIPNDDRCLNQPNGTLLPYPYDCAWYIRCEENEPIVKECEDGWLFNSILLICDYPENVGCVATPYPTTITTPSTTQTQKPTQTPTQPITPTTSISTPTASSTSDTTSSPNPTQTQTQSQSPTIPTSSGSTSTPTTPQTPSTSTKPPYVGTGICANQELGTLLPYPGKCSLYIVCEEPAPIAISCGPNLEFNAELKICQIPEEAGCSIFATTTDATTTEVTASPGVGICANHPIGELLPYPGNCSLYIRCELPAPIALACGDDLEFNAELQLCESAYDAGCSTFPSTTTTVPDIPTTPKPQPGMTGICRSYEEGDLIPYPGDCTKYIICRNPIPIAQRCGVDLHFNADLGICDEPDDAGCSDESGSTTVPPQSTTISPNDPGMTGVCKGHQEGDLIPYPGSCTKYIRCEIPVPIAQTCQSGLFFNEALGICDTIESVDCPGYSTTAKPDEGTTLEPPTTTTPKPPPMTGICRDQEPGDLIPYPGSCSKYIICESPVPIAMTCNDGLHFNADLQICDEPQAAGCEEASSTTTSSPPTTAPPSNVCCGAPIDALVPYPEDCTQYIRCEYPIPVPFTCCDGLHFNAVTQSCEAIESANCQWYTTTPAPRTCATQPNGTLLPFESDCKKYNYCSNGAAVTLPCPGGSIFSEDDGGCVPGTTCSM